MTALIDVTTAISAAATEGDVKNFLASVDGYLASLFGRDGTKETAIATVGASPFPAGTAMLFAQASAPTGWTKSTTHNDKALRVVSGTSGGSAGGSVAFSTVFGRTASDGSSLSIAQMANHDHALFGSGNNGVNPLRVSASTVQFSVNALSPNTWPTGSGSAHSHGMDLRVRYIDVIIATKD